MDKNINKVIYYSYMFVFISFSFLIFIFLETNELSMSHTHNCRAKPIFNQKNELFMNKNKILKQYK